MKEPHDLYSQYNDNYKLGVVIAWMLSFFVIVLNASAILVIASKKHRLIRRRHAKNNRNNKRHRFSRISISSRIESSLYKPDELIVLSLCVSNLFVGFAAAIKIMAFITEARDPWFHIIISYVVTFAMFVSLIHILLLSLERFLAVRSPFCHQDLQNKQTGYILLVVWLLSVLPPILNQNPSFSLLVSALMIISYIILIVTYAFIFHMMGIAFRNNTNSIVDDADDYHRQKERERRSTFSCCSIVISYILCTLLPVIKLLTTDTGINSLDSTMDVLMFIFLLMRSVSDPLVYTLRNKIYNIGMYLCNCTCRRQQNKSRLLEIDDFNLDIDDAEEVYIWFQTSRETRL